MKKLTYILIILTTLLQACGTHSDVTSNFSIQKRKYTKGWNVKDKFHRKQTADASSSDQRDLISKTEAKPIEKRTENIRETKQTSETTTGELTEVQLSDPVPLHSNENTDDLKENKQISGIPAIENAETIDSNDKIAEMHEDEPEKIKDEMFRNFFILGFSIAILVIVVSPIILASEFAAGLLLVLFLFDIGSVVLVILLLVERYKNKGMYKESALFILLTELLFGIVSYLALLFFIEFSAF